MKKCIVLMLLFLLVLGCFSITLYAHSGGTDGAGGHTNHSTGEYHYHHGRPAHQHPNGVCPYANSNNTSAFASDGELGFVFPLIVSVLSGGASIYLFAIKKKDEEVGCLRVFCVLVFIISVTSFIGKIR